MDQGKAKVCRILIVDDNPGDRRLVCVELSSLSSLSAAYEFVEAETLGDAFSLLGEQAFDAALLDMGLPDCTGLETVKRFTAFVPHMPVVVLTGMNDHQVGVAAVASGAQDYLVKGQGGGELLHRALSYAIERKANQQRLQESETFQRSMLQQSPIGVSVTTLDGIVLFVNQRFSEMVGVPPTTLCGQDVRRLYFRPEQREHLVSRVLSGETVSDQEIAIYQNGALEPLWTLASMRMARWDDQPAILTWVYDISARKTYEDTLRRSRDEAEALAEARSEFVSLISHEVRTPMMGVMGTVRLLLDSALDDAQRDHAETISYAGEALIAVLDDVLEFSKLESGGGKLDATPFDLRRTVDAVVALMNSRAQEKGLRLITRIDKALPRLLVGDAKCLRQILLNLVGNAVRFTLQGEVVVSVDDAGWDSEGRSLVRFMISDTGPGIQQSQLPHLFTGHMGAEGASRRLRGTGGLGLSICSRLCQMTGGRIGVDSALGRGSTFWIEMPLGNADREHHKSFQPACDEPVLGTRAPAGSAFSPLGHRVLLVEDNLINRKVVGGLLVRQGYEVQTAFDGVEAVERCKGEVFDAILMDIQMPRMDGLEATREIRAMGGSNLSVPIIALTANVMLEQSRDCQDAGMNAFLSKPVKPQVLYDTLAGLIVQRRRRFNPNTTLQAAKTENAEVRTRPGAGCLEGTLCQEPDALIPRTSGQEEAYSPETLAGLCRDLGKSLLSDLLSAFFAQAEDSVGHLYAALANGVAQGDSAGELSLSRLRRACHDVRATAQNCGFLRVAGVAEQLESDLFAEQHLDPDQVSALKQALQDARVYVSDYMPEQCEV